MCQKRPEPAALEVDAAGDIAVDVSGGGGMVAPEVRDLAVEVGRLLARGHAGVDGIVALVLAEGLRRFLRVQVVVGNGGWGEEVTGDPIQAMGALGTAGEAANGDPSVAGPRLEGGAANSEDLPGIPGPDPSGWGDAINHGRDCDRPNKGRELIVVTVYNTHLLEPSTNTQRILYAQNNQFETTVTSG